MKWLEDYESEKCCMSMFECDCGFHIGLDASYLDQVGNLKVRCPVCKEMVFNADELLGLEAVANSSPI